MDKTADTGDAEAVVLAFLVLLLLLVSVALRLMLELPTVVVVVFLFLLDLEFSSPRAKPLLLATGCLSKMLAILPVFLGTSVVSALAVFRGTTGTEALDQGACLKAVSLVDFATFLSS